MRKTMALLPLLGMASIAGAQGIEPDSSLTLGLGIGYSENIYKGIDDKTSVVPGFAYENGSFYLRGPEVGYYLIDEDEMKFGVLTRYRMDGFKASDSDDLAGMSERKGAFELGLTTSYETAFGEWSATLLGDASSEHKGYELTLDWEKRLRLSSSWMLIPEASVSYLSADLADYYYGVKASEATAHRAAYSADAATVYELGIKLGYMIDKNQLVMMGAHYQSFSNEITDSSIVEDDSSAGVKVLYMYRF